MAEFIDWFKALSSFVKDNKWLILWAAGAIAGWTGTGVQTIEANTAKQEAMDTRKQVAAVANHFTKTTAPKVVVHNCGECIKRIEEVNREVDKLKRWH